MQLWCRASTIRKPARYGYEGLMTISPRPSRRRTHQLIKIDVEGFEFSVLKGLSRFLAEFKPVIVSEIKPWESRNLRATLDDFAKSIGMGFSTHYQPTRNTGGIRVPLPIWKWLYSGYDPERRITRP